MQFEQDVMHVMVLQQLLAVYMAFLLGDMAVQGLGLSVQVVQMTFDRLAKIIIQLKTMKLQSIWIVAQVAFCNPHSCM